MAIISDAPRLQAWTRLVKLGIDEFFDIVITKDDAKGLKKEKKPFLVLMKKLNVKPNEVMMVGDHPKADIKAAKELGIITVFSIYGTPFKLGNIKPDYIIYDIKELIDIVDEVIGN